MARATRATAVVFAALFLAHGCVREGVDVRAPRQVLAPLQGEATCSLAGATQFDQGTPVFASSTGEEKIASFTGGTVRINVETVTSRASARAHVVVRDSPKGPGLVVRGWLEARALHLYAARDLAIVAPHVVIPRDEAIAIVGAAGTLARVAPRYGEFTSLVHDTPCDASSLALSATATRTPLSGKTWVHLAARTASLFSGAEGGPILSLDASREGPSFLAIEERAGRVHVRYRDGVAIDGWIRAAELLPGEGPDCDDCHGWPLEMADSCPCLEPSEDADGCPEVPSAPSRAVMTAPVRTRPDETSAAIGELESGASVCARETRGAYTHVVAGGGIASTGGGFWVPSASLAAQ